MERAKRLLPGLELRQWNDGEYYLHVTSRLGTVPLWITEFTEGGRPEQRRIMYAWIEEQFEVDKERATEKA